MTIKLIIGLRNPGSAYEHTRHNVGDWFVQLLAKSSNSMFKVEKKLHAEIAESSGCRLVLPLTFMNHSGLPVREVSQFYKIQPEEILVVHDDLDLPAGRIKLKTGGGHGGHNGLRDIIAQLGSAEFHRLRIGIDHPGHKDEVLNYVLGKPSQPHRQLILEALDRAIAVLPELKTGDMAAAMNILHR